MASFIETEHKPHNSVHRGLELVKACHRLIEANPDYLLLFRTYSDVCKALDTGRTALLLSVEGGEILGGSLAMLSTLHGLGVRSIGLTWNQANDIAGGVKEPGGLSKFGEEVITEMNRLGMLVDVSHLSDPAFWDVMRVTQTPVIASHSCCRAVHNNPRNLTDDQIKELAAGGGVIGINFYANFLTGGEAKLQDVIRHVEHVCSLVGPDYVGVGSDFDGCDLLPAGLEDTVRLPELAKALLAQGYSGENVEKIMGGNFFRVLNQVIG